MKIKINNQLWQVDFISNLTLELNERLGVCSYNNNRIYIAIGISKEIQKRVLIHELTHAYEYSHGLIDMKSDSKSEDMATFNENYAEQIVSMANKIMEGIR